MRGAEAARRVPQTPGVRAGYPSGPACCLPMVHRDAPYSGGSVVASRYCVGGTVVSENEAGEAVALNTEPCVADCKLAALALGPSVSAVAVARYVSAMGRDRVAQMSRRNSAVEDEMEASLRTAGLGPVFG